MADTPSLYCFRKELICEPLLNEESKPKFRIYDQKNDISFELGKAEHTLALLFNGKRSLENIQLYALEHLKININLEKLEKFQARLLQLGLISENGKDISLSKDPATGITYGPLKQFLLINLIKMNPQRGLDKIYEKAPWICTITFNLIMLLLVIISIIYLFNNWQQFSNDLVATYSNSWAWLIWHYPVILSSIAVHELGHALSCRHYRVRVTDFGIGVYVLLATGWVRPEQKAWSKLNSHKRAMTILMGPIASFYYSALGILVWASSGPTSIFHSLGVVMVVASSLSLIPTLLPFFNGDTYLALTEFYNQPRLRQRAFRYCRKRITGIAIDPDKDSRLYWIVCLLTVLGWVLAWCGIAMIIFRLTR